MQTDLAAEQAVLGAMLLEKEAVERAMAEVRPRDFRRPAHRVLFETMVRLYRTKTPAAAWTARRCWKG